MKLFKIDHLDRVLLVNFDRSAGPNRSDSSPDREDKSAVGSYDDEDTELGGGAADDDTSAGYSFGDATGNSSAGDTGLGSDGATNVPTTADNARDTLGQR
jgi:hypothetical protein